MPKKIAANKGCKCEIETGEALLTSSVTSVFVNVIRPPLKQLFLPNPVRTEIWHNAKC